MSDFATEYLRNSVKLPNHEAMSALDKDIVMFSLCLCLYLQSPSQRVLYKVRVWLGGRHQGTRETSNIITATNRQVTLLRTLTTSVKEQ